MIKHFYLSLLFVVFSLPALAHENRDSVIYTLSDDVSEMMVHVRAQGTVWSLLWDYVDDENYRMATIKLVSATGGDDLFNYQSRVTVSKVTDGVAVSNTLKDITHVNRDASLKITVSDNAVRLFAGDRNRLVADESLMCFDGKPGSKIVLRADKPMKKMRIVKGIKYRVPATLCSYDDINDLYAHLSASKDSIEGVWEYLDRNVNTPTVQQGGFYDLATVKTADGYDVIYLGGANMYSSLWKPLQIKGHITPTIFKDNFDLKWIDGKRTEIMDRDVYVTFEQNSIMTVHFPLLESELRFSRKRR